MTSIDHIFIFSNEKGIEADILLANGFQEGASRIHPGQGTINRKFYFENFFLEVLWIHDKKEFNSDLVRSSGLCNRASFRKTAFSRFGICLVNSVENDEMFEECYKYQPFYFSNGNSIDVLKNETTPALPWTFRLPFRNKSNIQKDFSEHPNKIEKLTGISLSYKDNNLEEDYLKFFKDDEFLSFQKSLGNKLFLEFDYGAQKRKIDIPELDLLIEY